MQFNVHSTQILALFGMLSLAMAGAIQVYASPICQTCGPEVLIRSRLEENAGVARLER